MPVRSLNSPVLKWPDAKAVDEAVRRWAVRVAKERPDVVQIGYLGSYARGDWGVGSDLDLIIIVNHSDKLFENRASDWDTLAIPVATDVLVYTQKEWQNLAHQRSFLKNLAHEVIWIY
jgi:predicted nucleotidyltransferase